MAYINTHISDFIEYKLSRCKSRFSKLQRGRTSTDCWVQLLTNSSLRPNSKGVKWFKVINAPLTPPPLRRIRNTFNHMIITYFSLQSCNKDRCADELAIPFMYKFILKYKYKLETEAIRLLKIVNNTRFDLTWTVTHTKWIN